MEIDKSLLVELLRATGTQDQAARAATLLPDPVDVDRDREVLEQVGLDRSRLDQHLSQQARDTERVGVPQDAQTTGGAQVHPNAAEEGSSPSRG